MGRVYPTVVAAVAAFLLYVTIMVVSIGVGVNLPVTSFISIGVGILLMVLGNLMGKITRNHIVGIRTPWTLSSEEVWFRTHRLGGVLLVLAGLALTINALLDGGLVFAVSLVIAAAVVPAAYSYVLARRLREDKRGGQQ